jgi:hypothetical protein
MCALIRVAIPDAGRAADHNLPCNDGEAVFYRMMGWIMALLSVTFIVLAVASALEKKTFYHCNSGPLPARCFPSH